MTYRILVTGSRAWTQVEPLRAALTELVAASGYAPNEVTVVHGKAQGANKIFDRVAKELGCVVEPHRANWEWYGNGAGPFRNQDMVNLGADVCLAAPLGVSRDTRGCMEMARVAGIPIVEVTESDET